MALSTLLSLVVTAALAVGGWYVAHRLNVSRVRASKRRELRVRYLIDAYRQLEWASNRPSRPLTAPKFETALADIQLFGTAKQVRLAQTFAVDLAKNLTSSLDELLEDLRHDLRRELDLEDVPREIRFLRATFKEEESDRLLQRFVTDPCLDPSTPA